MPGRLEPISVDTMAVAGPDGLSQAFGDGEFERMPTFPEVLGAAFRTESLTYNLWRRMQRENPGATDITHNPTLGLEERYLPYMEEFLGSKNATETAQIKSRIDEGLRDAEIARRAGGTYVLNAIGAGLLDPILWPLLALPALRAGKTLGQTALRYGTAVGGEVAAAEAFLHSQQPVRTWQESMAAIGGGVVLGGVLGAAVGRASDDLLKAIDTDTRILGDAIEPAEMAQAAGAAQARMGTPDKVARSEFTRKLFHGFSPLTRGLSSRFGTVRRWANEMFEHNIVIRDETTGEIMNWTGKTAEAEFREFTTTRMAQIRMTLNENFQALQRSGNKMQQWQFEEAVGQRLNTERWGTPNEFIDKSASFIRKQLDEIGEELKAVGRLDPNAKPKFAVFYRPRKYDLGKIREQTSEFVDFLALKFAAKTAFTRAQELELQSLLAKERTLKTKNQTLNKQQQDRLAKLKEQKRTQVTPEMARADARAVVDKILGTPLGRIPQFQDDVTPSVGHLQERMLALTDEELAPWLVSNVTEIMQDYLPSVGAELTLLRRFGDLELQGLRTAVTREAEQLKKGVSAKEGAQIEKELRKNLADIEHVRDTMLGRLGPRGDAANNAANIASNVRGAIFMAQLGMMTIAALPDLARPVAMHGLTNWLKAIPFNTKALVRGTRAYKHKRELQKMGIATDLLLQSRLYALNPEVANMSQRMFRATTTFARATGMLHWNTAMKTIAANVAMDSLLASAARQGPRGLRKLALAGIDEDLATRINQQFTKYGEVDSGMRLPNTAKWKDLEAKEAFEAAIRRDVDTTIVTPGLGDRPVFMSTEAGKFFLQFKSFFLAAHNQMMIPMAQRLAMGDIHAVQGIAMGLLLGVAVEMIRETVAGRGERLEDYEAQDWVIAAVDRMGVVSIPMEVFNIADRLSNSRLREMVGASPGSRFFARNVAGTVFGPVGNYVQDVGSVMSRLASEGELTESDLRAIRRIAPYQNVFYLRQLLDQGEEALADYFNLPERRQ